MVSRFHGVDSEVGTLRTVIVHRPGAELKRALPRDTGHLLFSQLPWAARAQQEHDMFTQVLRDHGVQVLYLTELLQDVLEYSPARQQAIDAALGAVMLGDELTGQVRCHLEGLDPEALSEVLIAGLTAGEFGGGRGVVYQLLPGSDFIIEPLPNLVFFRDCGVWIGDRVAVASPAAADRRIHAQLTDIIYAHHPLFAGSAGAKSLYGPDSEPMEGGDVLLVAPGVIAAGSSPAGVARLARRVFDAGLAHTVLVVSLGHLGRRLDTACTMVSADTVLMRPATAYSLTTRVLTPGGDGLRASHPQSFLVSAAQAAGLDRLRVIETGLGPATAGREQWDDAGNLLVLGPGLVVSHERNVASHARLERSGVQVITVPGSELCGVRGGPRSLCCPVSRDPALLPGDLSSKLSACAKRSCLESGRAAR
jgi:arginine deiminase